MISNVAVCVIGGGVSGLKAAHRLIHHPESRFAPSDVVLLEAQESLGGRIKTDRTSSVLGNHYDLGASWYHDSLTNSVLKELASDPDFVFARDTEYNDQDPMVFDSKGVVELVDSRLNKVLEDMEKYIEIHFFDSLNTPDVSLKEIAQQFVLDFGHTLTDEQKLYAARLIRYLELWYGIPWDTISGKYSIMDHQGRNLFNKRGYDYLVFKLVTGLPSEVLQCNQQVTAIHRNNKDNERKFRVQTAEGTVYCDYLVVTVPQSILQLTPTNEYSITWTPPLPQNVSSAIDSVHFAALGKVIFEFDKVWWPNKDSFQILANEESNQVSVLKPLTGLPVPFTYPAYVVNLAEKGSSSGALCILTQDPLTTYLEANPDEAWNYFGPMLSILSTSSPSSASSPINVITSNWTTNPFIRGSYTCLHTGDDPSDLIIQLSGEVDIDGCGLTEKTIRFAGEHTVSDGAGCVHGAFDSGAREANWIVEDYNGGTKRD